MRGRGGLKPRFAAPQNLVILLVCANLAVYGLCVVAGGQSSIPSTILFANGALYPGALQPEEWWRLLAAGFLHANLIHVGLNCLSLLMIGPLVLRRLGEAAFGVVYLVSLVGGSVTSVLLHTRPFLGVGASGAIFGLMAALVALWMLGSRGLSGSSLLTNVGLNAVLTLQNPRIDWAAHLGGFVAGLVAVGVLELGVRVNRRWLVCKFPEFVKANGLVLVGVGAAWLWAGRVDMPWWLVAPVIGPVVLLGIKGLDTLLSVRRGLALTVAALAVGNAVAGYWMATLYGTVLTPGCDVLAGPFGDTSRAMPALCPIQGVLPWVAAAGAVLVTVGLYNGPLMRGMQDMGFVGASLRAERQRARSLAGKDDVM